MPPNPSHQEVPRAWILSIGNELLIGRIVNTNASWLARMLSLLGFEVTRIITVPDSVDDISEELTRGLRRARVIVTTGGLGPTYDDRTLEAVAKALGVSLELNEEALEMVREFYSKKGLQLTPEREKMAMLPIGAKPLPNPVGAAPGVIIEHDGTVIVSLPGVPAEMKAIFETYVVPLLRGLAPPRYIVECSLVIEGVPESSLAPVLKRLAKENPEAYIKSHPKGHEILGPVLDVRVLVSSPNVERAEEKAKRIIESVESEAKRLGGQVKSKSCGAPG